MTDYQVDKHMRIILKHFQDYVKEFEINEDPMKITPTDRVKDFYTYMYESQKGE